MEFIEHFYIKTLKHDFINKFYYKSTKKIPRLQKIVLNFNCKNSELKTIVPYLLALEIITQQKSKITLANQSNILLKIRKGNPIGCKVTLRKNRMFNYFIRSLLDIFPKIKNFDGLTQKNLTKNSFSYRIPDIYNFQELEDNYYLFNSISKLELTIVASTTTKNELIFLLKSLKLPIRMSIYNSIGRV